MLKEFDVNGKTIHLVQRVPPQFNQQQPQQAQQQDSSTNNRGRIHTEETNIFINANSPPDMQGLFQQIFSGLGDLSGANITTSSTNATSPNAPSMDIQIDLGNMTNQMNEQEIRNRIRSIRRILTHAESRLNRLQEIQSGAPLNDVIGSQIVIQASRAIPIIPGIGPITPPLDTITSINITQPETQNTNATNTEQTAQNEPQQPQNIRLEVLADVLQSTMNAYSRFLPYLQDYHRLLVEDTPEPAESEQGENRRQRFCNNINDMLHLMGHLFHNLSDLHVNLRDTPPRNMRTMAPMQAAVVSVPFEATIQVPLSVNTNQQQQQQSAEEQNQNTAQQSNRQEDSQPQASTNSNTNQESLSQSLFSNVQSLANFFLSRGSRSQSHPRTNPSTTHNFSSDENSSSSSDSSPPPLEPVTSSTTNPNLNNNNSNNNPNTNTESSRTLPSLFSRPPPPPPPPPFSGMDPYLSCNSVHLLTNNLLGNNTNVTGIDLPLPSHMSRLSTHSQRRRHPAGNRTTSTSSGLGLPETPADLNRFFSDLIAMNRTQTPSNTITNPSNPLATSFAFATITTRPLNQNQSSTSQTIPSAAQASTLIPQRQEKTVKNDILNLLESNDQNDKRLDERIETIFKIDNPQKDKKFWQLINFAIGKLKLNDLIKLNEDSCDFSKIFYELRKPLEVYIQKNIINYENFNSYFNGLIDEFMISCDIVNFFKEDDFIINCEIEFKRSLENILKYHIRILTNHVLDDDHTNWSLTFHKYLKACRDHLILLFKKCFKTPSNLLKKWLAHCFVNNQIIGDQKFDRFLKEYLEALLEKVLKNDNCEQTNINELLTLKKSKIDNKHLNTKSEKREAEDQSVLLSDNTWESYLPSDWAPIIQNDIETQAKQPKQAPFSDAYLCGMPAKRRKILSKLDVRVPSIFETIMQSTLQQIKSKKSTTNDQILERACNDTQLANAFETSFDTACIDRLKHDADFKDIITHQSNDENNSNENRMQYSKKRLQ